ncbi:hypothetical protein [Streptosporangium sp. V21-05]|uniref:hypothetical protein n=1 Tax=Streptosporangium sp. V21-05 TaxID=3446115 RepID=UPI003F52F289
MTNDLDTLPAAPRVKIDDRLTVSGSMTGSPPRAARPADGRDANEPPVTGLYGMSGVT